MHFNKKPIYLANLNSKTVFLNTFPCILFTNFCVVAAMQLIVVKLKDIFLYEHQSIGSLHWHRHRLKIQKQPAIMDHILFEGYNATNYDFSILIPENNQFKLHFKESLLIKRNIPELNKNIFIHPFELFA